MNIVYTIFYMYNLITFIRKRKKLMSRTTKNFITHLKKRRINMKHSGTKIFILALFFALATILGCGEDEQPPATTAPEVQKEAREEIEESRDKTTEETGGVIDPEAEFPIEQKEEYIAKVNEQLLVMGTKIQELKDYAVVIEGETRTTMEQQVDNLRAMHERATNQFSTMKEQGMENWAEAKQNMDNTMQELEEAYQAIKTKYE
jgi:archaellum component FlaC